MALVVVAFGGCRDFPSDFAQCVAERRCQAELAQDGGAGGTAGAGGGSQAQEDAGEPDAGGVDAGGVDAGEPDAGPGDAGLVDAGSADAGASDGGIDGGGLDGGTDAGGGDAGTVDAGTDAGVADAGTDAGRPDAGVDGGTGARDAGPCVDLPDASVLVILTTSIDDDGAVYVNGQQVDVPSPWYVPVQRYVNLHISNTEPNVVAVRASNHVATYSTDRAALLVLDREVLFTRGQQLLVTDNRWKVASAVSSTKWLKGEFDDSSWAQAVEQVPYGAPPYGTFTALGSPVPSGASWVWSYNNADASAPHTPEETVYLRRAFFMLRDGGLSFDAGSCP